MYTLLMLSTTYFSAWDYVVVYFLINGSNKNMLSNWIHLQQVQYKSHKIVSSYKTTSSHNHSKAILESVKITNCS